MHLHDVLDSSVALIPMRLVTWKADGLAGGLRAPTILPEPAVALDACVDDSPLLVLRWHWWIVVVRRMGNLKMSVVNSH